MLPYLEHLCEYLCDDGRKETYFREAYEIEINVLGEWLDMGWTVIKYNIHIIKNPKQHKCQSIRLNVRSFRTDSSRFTEQCVLAHCLLWGNRTGRVCCLYLWLKWKGGWQYQSLWLGHTFVLNHNVCLLPSQVTFLY